MLTGALQTDIQLDKEVYAPGEKMRATLISTQLPNGGVVSQVKAGAPEPSPGQPDSPEVHAIGAGVSPDLKAGPPGRYELRLYGPEAGSAPIAVRAYEVKAP
jgi:hypothetical protein